MPKSQKRLLFPRFPHRSLWFSVHSGKVRLRSVTKAVKREAHESLRLQLCNQKVLCEMWFFFFFKIPILWDQFHNKRIFCRSNLKHQFHTNSICLCSVMFQYCRNTRWNHLKLKMSTLRCCCPSGRSKVEVKSKGTELLPVELLDCGTTSRGSGCRITNFF